MLCLCGACVEVLRQGQAVDRLDQIEQITDNPHLIALQMADQMPLDLTPQGFDLGLGFLHAILAEHPLTSIDGLTDALHRHRFRHRHERDPLWITADAGGGFGDPLLYGTEVVCHCPHGHPPVCHIKPFPQPTHLSYIIRSPMIATFYSSVRAHDYGDRQGFVHKPLVPVRGRSCKASTGSSCPRLMTCSTRRQPTRKITPATTLITAGKSNAVCKL